MARYFLPLYVSMIIFFVAASIQRCSNRETLEDRFQNLEAAAEEVNEIKKECKRIQEMLDKLERSKI